MAKIIDKLAWLYIKNKRILSTRSKGKDTFYLPGGKRDDGESDWEALQREIQEELSVDLVQNSLHFFGVFTAIAHGHSNDTTVKMTCYFAEYTGNLVIANEIEEMAWLTYDEKWKSSAVDHLIFDALKAKRLL